MRRTCLALLALLLVVSRTDAQNPPPFRCLEEQIPVSGTLLGGVGDFDADFDPDILNAGRIQVNDGSGRFAEGPAIGTWFPASPDGLRCTVAIADVNGDGLPDVLTGGSVTTNLHLNDGALGLVAGPPTPPLLPAGSSDIWSAALGDVDGDGDQDACIAYHSIAFNPPPAIPRLWLNGGTGVFTDVTAARFPAIAPLVDHVVFRDFDGDGDLDIFLWQEEPPDTWSGPGPATPSRSRRSTSCFSTTARARSPRSSTCRDRGPGVTRRSEGSTPTAFPTSRSLRFNSRRSRPPSST